MQISETSQTIANLSGIQEFKYDAFISYRHSPTTDLLAPEILRLIETYKAPKHLKPGFLRKVFIDKGDLAAGGINNQITDALKSSKFLIALSSPEYTGSQNTRLEIENFLEMHGEKIIIIIFEGSISENLQPLKELGLLTAVLAADIRPEATENKKAIKQSSKKLRTIEIFRVLAQILDCKPDELIQREKRRKRATVIKWICVAAALAILAVAGYFFYKATEKERAISIIHDNMQVNLNKVDESLRITESYFSFKAMVGDIEVLDLEREAIILGKATAPIYNITAFSEYRLDSLTYYNSLGDKVEKSGLEKETLENYYYNLQRLQEHYLSLQDKLALFCRNSTKTNYDILMLAVAQVWSRSMVVYYNALVLFDDLNMGHYVSKEDAKYYYLSALEQTVQFGEQYSNLLESGIESSNKILASSYDSLKATDDDNMDEMYIKIKKLRALNEKDMALEVYDVWEQKFGQEDGMDKYLEIARKFTQELDYSTGVYITEVSPDSSALNAGIKQYDVIIGYNGQTFTNTEGLIDMIDNSTEKENSVTLYRLEGGRMVMHTVTVPTGKLGVVMMDL